MEIPCSVDQPACKLNAQKQKHIKRSIEAWVKFLLCIYINLNIAQFYLKEMQENKVI